MAKTLSSKDFEKSEIIQQIYSPTLAKGRGSQKLIGELDKAGKHVKTATGWVPVKGNEHLVNKHDEKKKEALESDLSHNMGQGNEEAIKEHHTKKEIPSEIQSKIDSYKGGTIPVDVLVHLKLKYENAKPVEEFDSVMGAKVKVYGKEGTNYAINIGGSKGIVLASFDELNEIRQSNQEVKVDDSKAFDAVISEAGKMLAEKYGMSHPSVQYAKEEWLKKYGTGSEDKFNEAIETSRKAFENVKPIAKVVGENGNVFNTLAIVGKALRKAGQGEKIKEMNQKVFKAGSYEEALHIMGQYADLQ